MSYCGFIVEVKELRKHSNADRLNVATFFGNDTIVDLSVNVGDIGVYFPVDGQLSIEFCDKNNLVRKKDDAGNNIGGYLDPDKRNIRALKLRGEKSDGLFLPLSCFDYLSKDVVNNLNIGDQITILDGHEICTKYIPRTNPKRERDSGNRVRKKKVPISPLFKEHADTEQLAYNLGRFKLGDQIEITLKMDGTSQRTGYLPVLKRYKKSLLDIILRKDGKPIYDWGYVSGTRRVVLEDFEGGYYGSNSFREEHSKFFEGKLLKGEEVFYEVVGYTNDGSAIMGKANTPKEYQDKYGKEMVFSYGCEVGKSDFFVYRMTMTNEDGDVFEYPPYLVRYRCEQMGCKTVPLLDHFEITKDKIDGFGEAETPGEYVKYRAEFYYDGEDPIGKTHVREGVVVRVVNRPSFTAFKHKNFLYKLIRGMINDNTKDVLSEDIAQEM